MGPGTENPWKEHGTRDRDPMEGTWDQTARKEVTSYRAPRGQTDTCKNITLPQTSFAGGNKSEKIVCYWSTFSTRHSVSGLRFRGREYKRKHNDLGGFNRIRETSRGFSLATVSCR